MLVPLSQVLFSLHTYAERLHHTIHFLDNFLEALDRLKCKLRGQFFF